jgi:hypothetical protein
LKKILLLVFLLTFACGKEIKITNTLQFKVDNSLLEVNEIKDSVLHLSYRIPVGFKEIKLKKNLDLKKIGFDSISSLPLINKSFYFDEKLKSILVYSIVDPKINRNDALNSLEEFSKKTSLWKKTNYTNFIYNKISFNQFILQSNDHVVFKMLVDQDSDLLEINYIIPKLSYTENTARKLESSIGSIKKNINY